MCQNMLKIYKSLDDLEGLKYQRAEKLRIVS